MGSRLPFGGGGFAASSYMLYLCELWTLRPPQIVHALVVLIPKPPPADSFTSITLQGLDYGEDSHLPRMGLGA